MVVDRPNPWGEIIFYSEVIRDAIRAFRNDEKSAFNLELCRYDLFFEGDIDGIQHNPRHFNHLTGRGELLETIGVIHNLVLHKGVLKGVGDMENSVEWPHAKFEDYTAIPYMNLEHEAHSNPAFPCVKRKATKVRFTEIVVVNQIVSRLALRKMRWKMRWGMTQGGGEQDE